MKILHAPIDVSKQAGIIVKAQKAQGAECHLMVFDKHDFWSEHDICLDLNKKNPLHCNIIKIINFIYCTIKYDLFHFHYGLSLLPFNADLPILKLFGKKTIMHYWGSDIRQSDIAIHFVYFKTLDELQKIYPEKGNNTKRKKIIQIKKYVNLTIVGDYPLLPYSCDSLVVKQAIDLSKFDFVGFQKKKKIKFCHAPSNRDTKGTKYVLSTIERLRLDRYEFDFILVENKKFKEALEIYKECDVIIEQIVLESHGILLLEGMALGKTVLCRIDEKFLKYYQNIPIINTNPDNLYENMKQLIEKPDMCKELGEKGREYVENVHDSKKIAKQLLDLYKSI